MADRSGLRLDALDLLDAAYPDWRSTIELADSLGLNPYERSAHLYPQLRRLTRDGQIQRKWPIDYRTVFWRVIECRG